MPRAIDVPTLRRDVDTLCQDGTRRVGTVGHERARRHLVSRLAAIGVSPYAGRGFELPYAGGRFTNVIGLVPGRAADGRPPLLVAAHYDTCGDQPGADDNATACAVTLALAERFLGSRRLESDLVVALYDAEEPLLEPVAPEAETFLGPNMGSRRFWDEQARERPRFSLVFDLIGHALPVPGHEDRVFLLGAESHADARDAVSDALRPERAHLVAVTLHERYLGMSLSDYDAAKRAGFPFVFLSCGRWEHYHQVTDTPDRLDLEKASRIGELAGDLLAAADRRDFRGRAAADTDALDLATMERGFGPLLRRSGIELRSRRDIDRAVPLLMQFEAG